MFCYQCQEAAGNLACTIKGVCGKGESTSALQDLLIHTLKGIGIVHSKARLEAAELQETGRFVIEGLFATITNANFDDRRFVSYIDRALKLRDRLITKYGLSKEELHDAAEWNGSGEEDYRRKAPQVGILSTTENEDLRSLQELIIYGLKGMAAYSDHAKILGYEETDIYDFMLRALAASTEGLGLEELLSWVMETGKYGVEAMKLLDRANTATYGNPEISKVNIGVRNRPGILISGHDLKDMEELLKQTEGTGVDVYTHSEMLPANYYPAFKKYEHFVGNYGNAWWKQNREFESFNGPIVMTTNCITPVNDSYRDRIFTTNAAGYPGVRHIPDRPESGAKDFSQVIELAKTCPPPTEIETGEIVGGFAHHQVMQLADKIVDAVKSGAIRRFVVMAGCDGRHKSRSYFTDLAQELPHDTVILTAGCAKYRYNKLELGDIGGIPRLLDAGQCNDSYSLAVIALKLKEVFELEDVNELPISFDLAWYEQKAVIVLLALLYLGFKGIRLGPSLPAFLSPNVVKVLVENFDIKPIGDVQDDIAEMLSDSQEEYAKTN
ncbi:MAG TPA: hydroxylamine reductase [Sediminispirochaeta sp.]|nr:hydroxylamine reductase [Sediminispirochaeta sp.]